jgi:hypothetical protein
MKQNGLQFKSQAACDQFFKKAKRASKSAQVKPEAPKATDDCIIKLKAKIKRLERQNEGLMKALNAFTRGLSNVK